MNNSGGKSLKLIQEFPLDQADLDRELQEYVLAEIKRTGGLTKSQHSNIGGWQSERDLHAKLSTETPQGLLLLRLFSSFSEPMMQYISSTAGKWNVPAEANYDWSYTGAWFNVSVRGSYNAPHTHPHNAISAAYYVRTEEPPKEYPFSGRIDFFYENGYNHFFPKAGTLILFPSDVLHFVHPYYGQEHRICLSFNADHIRQQKP